MTYKLHCLDCGLNAFWTVPEGKDAAFQVAVEKAKLLHHHTQYGLTQYELTETT